ncbi:MAG: glycogen synthase GlgA [Endomicrobiales bacterium]
MKIAMVASECVPFVKVGGLADVVGTLPRFLKAGGHDVRVIIPKYQKIDAKKFGLSSLPFRLPIPVGGGFEEATVKTGWLEGGVPVYFIENARYFYRPGVYGTTKGDYADNRERFTFFSRAALEVLKALNFQPDVLHCHDWQTGIIPAYLKTTYRYDGFYVRTSSAYTIHNIAYQGVFDRATVDITGLPWSEFTWDRLEYFGRFNFMKAALIYADALSTVSPAYAREIQTEEFGRGMEAILKTRRADLAGILNGIDYEEWNPLTDRLIAANYSKDDASGKARCKEDLQKLCGLPVKADAFLAGSVSRLDPQKGYDLVARVLPKVMERDLQFIVLGTGDPGIQNLLLKARARHPEKICLNFEFNNSLAHKIYAGSDAFLMPSRFEPCGLGQMIAMAYGSVPIVTKTGGLADTVEDFDPQAGTGNGFVVEKTKAAELKAALDRALLSFRDQTAWSRVMHNALSSDFSWHRSVVEYGKWYRKAMSKIKY